VSICPPSRSSRRCFTYCGDSHCTCERHVDRGILHSLLSDLDNAGDGVADNPPDNQIDTELK
jgi:hypothetical protein